MGDYDYDQLPTYVGNVIDEAINSMMKWLHFRGSVHTGFQGMVPGGSEIKISALGGHYEGSTFITGGQVTDAITGQPTLWYITDNGGWPFTDFPSLVAYFTDNISQLFQSWYGLPDPADFQNAVNQTREGTRLISYSPQLETPGPGCVPFGANDDLSHLSTMCQKWATFHGIAMNTFLDSYANKLPFVLGNQAAVAFMAWTTVAGEQDLWTKARDNVAEIAGKGIEAMKSADGPSGGGGGWEVGLLVVGALALIAAPFTDGLSAAAGVAVEGAAEGGAGVAEGLNAIGVVLQTSSAFVKEPQEKETAKLDADNPVAVVTNIANALKALNKQISTEEMNAVTGMNGLSQVITNGSFDLSNPALLYDTDTGDFGSKDEIKTELSDVQWVADTVIRVEVVPIIHNSSKALSSAVSSAAWSRPAGIGCGPMGPFYDWESVVTLVSNQIQDSATQLDRAADVLDLIVKDFSNLDHLVHDDLQDLSNKVTASSRSGYGGGGH